VSWSAPTDNGGSQIIGYNVYRRPSTGIFRLVVSLGNVTSYKDTTTARGATYYYAVSAVNGVGEGPKSGDSPAVVAK
jgi:fibronectin type 3 domain-containing protein